MARRLDGGGYVTIGTFEARPIRQELDALFFEDSQQRDRGLSFLDRLKKQLPNLGPPEGNVS